MPKWGPRRGKERFAREMMQEIEHKQRVLNEALGLGGIDQLDAQQRERVLMTAHVKVHVPPLPLQDAVEETVQLGRKLLHAVYYPSGKGVR